MIFLRPICFLYDTSIKAESNKIPEHPSIDIKEIWKKQQKKRIGHTKITIWLIPYFKVFLQRKTNTSIDRLLKNISTNKQIIKYGIRCNCVRQRPWWIPGSN